jgi:hypothetical protein
MKGISATGPVEKFGAKDAGGCVNGQYEEQTADVMGGGLYLEIINLQVHAPVALQMYEYVCGMSEPKDKGAASVTTLVRVEQQ